MDLQHWTVVRTMAIWNTHTCLRGQLLQSPSHCCYARMWSLLFKRSCHSGFPTERPDSQVSASNLQPSKALCKVMGWRPTEHDCSMWPCEPSAAEKLKFTVMSSEAQRLVCLYSEGQLRVSLDTRFLLLHFRLHLQTVLGAEYI